MIRILITGATGNIGTEVIHFLCQLNPNAEIIAAVRDVDNTKDKFTNYPNLTFRQFDFEDYNSFNSAFENVDILFLLRPPHISEVDKFFKPLLQAAKYNNINNIVFLSVQGAEKSKIIPHNKIERLIKFYEFDYIFVRPSYFMQNLTTTLLPELLASKTITLPSGKAKFNWIDAKNIGEATAHLLLSFEKYKNHEYEITGTENKNFSEVITLMIDVTGINFSYKSINPFRFYFKKKKEGVPSGFALVMTVLHFLLRLQKEPEISANFKMLTGKETTTLKEFIAREKTTLTGHQ